MQDAISKFLSKEGRLSRSGYVLCFVLPGATLLGGTAAAFTIAPELLLGPGSQVIAIGWLAYLTTMDAQNIRRYHDLGNSGGLYRVLRPFVVILPLIAFAVQFLIPAQMASMGDMGALAFLIQQEVAFHMSPVPLAVMALWFVGVVGNIVYLALMPGQGGPNSYGPSPGQGGGGPLPGVRQPTAEAGDPVERALADYRASLAKPRASATAASPARTAQASAAFGRKRQ